MALLAGSQLAANTLMLTQGSDRLLPEIFPRVPHIRRFNLKTEAAQRILTSADVHLATMALPYVMALHEDYIWSCLKRLQREGSTTASKLRGVRSHNMHEHLELAAGGTFTPDSLETFHLMRLQRNCLIHDAGRVDSALVTHANALGPAAKALYEQLSRKPLPGYAVD